jgi:AP endonuclease-2
VKAPSLATKYFPEFQGRQVSIKDMLGRQSANLITSKKDLVCLGSQQSSFTAKPGSAASSKKFKTENSAKITQFFGPKVSRAVSNPVKILQEVHVAQDLESDYREISSDFKAAEHFATTTILERNQASRAAWGALFKPPPPLPLCSGHNEPTVKRRVTKKGPNLGREFYACCRGEGRSDDPAARCDFFKWAK